MISNITIYLDKCNKKYTACHSEESRSVYMNVTTWESIEIWEDLEGTRALYRLPRSDLIGPRNDICILLKTFIYSPTTC